MIQDSELDSSSFPLITIAITFHERFVEMKGLLNSLTRQVGHVNYGLLFLSWDQEDYLWATRNHALFPSESLLIGLDMERPFHESLAKNILMGLAHTEYCALLNCDLLLPATTMSRICDDLPLEPKTYMYSDKVKLSRESTEQYRERPAEIDLLKYVPRDRASRHPVPGTGGIVYGNGDFLVIRREEFLKLGGYDEAFEGWGYADQDFLSRLHSSNSTQIDCSTKIPVFHQFHSYDQAWKNGDTARRNRRLLHDDRGAKGAIANRDRPWGLACIQRYRFTRLRSHKL